MKTPHTIKLYPQDEVLAGALVKGYVDGTPVDVKGQMTPSTVTAIFDQFGVDVKDGWLFMGNPGPQDLFEVGAQVEFNGRRFTVASASAPYIGFGAADHFSVALEGLND